MKVSRAGMGLKLTSNPPRLSLQLRGPLNPVDPPEMHSRLRGHEMGFGSFGRPHRQLHSSVASCHPSRHVLSVDVRSVRSLLPPRPDDDGDIGVDQNPRFVYD